MLLRVGCVEHVDQLRLYQALDHRAVDWHGAQGCLPVFCRARRQPVKADKVRWAEQDNAHYALPRRAEPAIAGRGNRPGIDVTGMRRDQRLRYGSNRGGSGATEEVIDLASELGGVRRVERSGDRSGTDGGQGWAFNRMLSRL